MRRGLQRNGATYVLPPREQLLLTERLRDPGPEENLSRSRVMLDCTSCKRPSSGAKACFLRLYAAAEAPASGMKDTGSKESGSIRILGANEKYSLVLQLKG